MLDNHQLIQLNGQTMSNANFKIMIIMVHHDLKSHFSWVKMAFSMAQGWAPFHPMWGVTTSGQAPPGRSGTAAPGGATAALVAVRGRAVASQPAAPRISRRPGRGCGVRVDLHGGW